VGPAGERGGYGRRYAPRHAAYCPWDLLSSPWQTSVLTYSHIVVLTSCCDSPDAVLKRGGATTQHALTHALCNIDKSCRRVINIHVCHFGALLSSPATMKLVNRPKEMHDGSHVPATRGTWSRLCKLLFPCHSYHHPFSLSPCFARGLASTFRHSEAFLLADGINVICYHVLGFVKRLGFLYA
jgi:hypothetical protein